MQLEPVWSLVPPGPKQDNIKTAVQVYAANVTWPAANLTKVQMDWCDCYYAQLVPLSSSDYRTLECKPGYFWTTASLDTVETHHQFAWYEGDQKNIQCCRPCFTAQN